jgi:hypothetical protein
MDALCLRWLKHAVCHRNIDVECRVAAQLIDSATCGTFRFHVQEHKEHITGEGER